jgi:chemotaxis protein MotB
MPGGSRASTTFSVPSSTPKSWMPARRRGHDNAIGAAMALSARRRYRAVDYWPGFVDALSTLLLVIIFLLTVFMIAQFLLGREVTGKDTALQRLNAQIEELTELLALERAGSRQSKDQLSNMQASLSAIESERDRLKADAASGADRARAEGGKAAELTTQLEKEKELSGRALSQVELLNQQISALRRQIAALEDALNASESRDRESQAKIADLGTRLNVALAQRVQELSRYKSDFFGRLRQILADRPARPTSTTPRSPSSTRSRPR